MLWSSASMLSEASLLLVLHIVSTEPFSRVCQEHREHISIWPHPEFGEDHYVRRLTVNGRNEMRYTRATTSLP